MKKILLFVLASQLLFASQTSVQEMLDHAKHAFSTQKTINLEREKRFLDDLNHQNQLLQQAQKELKKLKDESLRLNNTIDDNEKVLTKLEAKLHQRSGNLGELYGVVRQSSGDFLAQASESPLSALDPKRLKFLQTLSKTKKLPNTQSLNKLWYLFLEELTQQGKVWSINTKLVDTNGKESKASIMLNGPFASIYEEGFVQYLPKTNNFAV
ncbi:MAG: hypothetical protein OEW60_00815, partial [Thiovulaceae bacterium]|nr:hypothetical protein [Sulfurimonadaceae bacterium]